MEESNLGQPESSMERGLLDSSVDFDLMDELLSGDFLLENPSCSDLFQPSNSNSASPFDPSTLFSNGIFSEIDDQQAETETPSNWSIQTRNPVVPLKERLNHALRFIKESQRGSDVLAQIWVPVQSDGRNFLTTCGQPFWLDSQSQSLSIYRSVSTGYQFSAEENSDEIAGLPGRVFLGRVPEWSPDVRYFRSDEFPRVDHAQRYNVCGTIALPLFERDSRSCIGVVEVVFTTRKINYSSDLDNICNALQAVDLRSSDALTVPEAKVSNNSYQAALPEIQQVLKAICETHCLPLAQTWIACAQQGKKGSRHSSENYKNCVSTVDSACHVNDPLMLDFHKACSEHHLFRGQGVVGKAFTTNQPCFYPDVTSFTKTEYPLLHHAKLFNLRGAVAIRLRSIHTGKADFVLEFFLPIDCIGSEEQRLMLNSLSFTIRQVCKSLRVVTAKELEDDVALESDESYPTDIANLMNVQEEEESDMPASVPLEFSEQEIEELGVNTNRDTSEAGLSGGRVFAEFEQHQQSTAGQKVLFPSDSNVGRVGKATEKRRAKSEKSVSLQVLRQYFAGSLKDAAKSIGVCPTTLKRICRQHGISRWPSRKIKKVGHSLKKLQVVIDSVQGAEGTFQFSSVYENFTKASSPDKNLTGGTQTDHPESSNAVHQQQEGILSPHTCISNSLSSSSCSKSSSSSLARYPPQLVIKQEASADGADIAKPERENSEFVQSENPCLEKPSQLQKERQDLFKVKAVYGEEKVRFRLQPTWGFQELKQELLKRFNISDLICVDLKYVDDDNEWVLLTCDEDLRECVDVYKLSSGDTIKISIHQCKQRSGFR